MKDTEGSREVTAAHWRSAMWGDPHAADRCAEAGCQGVVRYRQLGGALAVTCQACGTHDCWTWDALAGVERMKR